MATYLRGVDAQARGGLRGTCSGVRAVDRVRVRLGVLGVRGARDWARPAVDARDRRERRTEEVPGVVGRPPAMEARDFDRVERDPDMGRTTDTRRLRAGVVQT